MPVGIATHSNEIETGIGKSCQRRLIWCYKIKWRNQLSVNQLEMSEGTIRQRKLFLSASIFLILMFHGGISLGNTMRIFGTSISVENPEFLISFLIFSQIYLAWRFYKYFHTDKAYSALKSQYSHALSQKRDLILTNHIFRSLPKGIISYTGSHSYSNLSKTDDSKGVYKIKVEYPVGGNEGYDSTLITVPKKIFRFQNVPIAIKFLVRGKIISDYYVPMLLGIYALLVNIV